MKNEPQLTAEMERKAEEVFEHYNGDGYANPCPRIPCDCQVKEYKHFLATALEEQRAEMVRKVEAYIDAKYPPNRFVDSSTGIMTRGVQEPTHVRMMGVDDGQTFNALEHVLDILNGKDTNE